MTNRAYSLFEIKNIHDDERIIEGVASTPTPDRDGDILEPQGAMFSLPMPLLFHHDHRSPIGNVISATARKDGISFRARLAKVDTPGVLKTRVDEAWQSIKSGLVRAVSVGFRSADWEPLKTGGRKFNKWDWFELSVVTIPANVEASILTVKQLDAAALGRSGRKPIYLSGATDKKVTNQSSQFKVNAMNIKETIKNLEATREAKAARMASIMEKAAGEGRVTDEAEGEECDTITMEIKSIDKDLNRLQALASLDIAKAAPVDGSNSAAGSSSRGPIITARPAAPKGTAFTRYAMSLCAAKGNLPQAHEIARSRFGDTPEVVNVLKAASEAGTTTDATWAAPLVDYTTIASEFIELLRPQTIVGRLGGLRRVPFNIRIPRQTAGGTYGWVGEGKPKPVGELAFDDITLRWAKASGIIVLTDELVRQSNPSAEQIVRDDMIAGIAKFLDEQFVDPTVAEVSNVSPASITYGVTPVNASGTDADAFRTDVREMWENTFLSQNLVPTSGVWIMSNTTAMRLSLMLNALGQPEFPSITPTGGTLLGYPVVTSESVAADSNGAFIIFANQGDILLAEDSLMLDSSNQASLQFDTAPSDPTTASTVMINLWQRNMVGLRVERYINWKKRRSNAVGVIDRVQYGV